jgi:fructan beta-fructosidase
MSLKDIQLTAGMAECHLRARNRRGLFALGVVKSWAWMMASWWLAWLQMGAGLPCASAANVMNYGADGNDYFQFTTPSLAFDKASGFTTLITFAMHVDSSGTLEIGGVACTNGVYVGPTNWGSLVAALKTPPTTVTRYEVCIGGWLDTSYDNIKSLIAAQGAGPGSMLYKNFLALKNAVPGIDAINDDDEKTYDLNSSVSLANMLGSLGYKFTLVPYTQQGFWVSLKNDITNCDYIYLQCYEGGAGNDPAQWNSAFGNGIKVIPGQESNTSTPGTFHNWYLETGVQGGFYYPDVVFSSTYWSAAISEANGVVPAAPTGLAGVLSGNQVGLSWNVVPGAISYNVKRATSSGAEVNLATVSTANSSWPASNQYTDTGPGNSLTYYYKVSAVNTNGESPSSSEVSVKPLLVAAWFKADTIAGLSNGSSVAIWPDSSGHGKTATQPTASQEPTYVTGAMNGLPVVHFNGSNNQVLTFSRPVQDDFTIFCVFRSTQGVGSGNQFYNGAGLVSGAVSGVANDFGAGLSASGQICAGAGNPDVSVSSIGGFNDGNPHLMTFKRTESSGEIDLYVDGNFYGSTTGTTGSLTAPLSLALGAQLTLSNYFSGDIGEVKLYNYSMSDADRAAQEATLTQKWGITGALAGMLAYESFNYPAGTILAGQNGGIGWSNGWVDVSGNASESVASGNLTVGGNAPAGFDGRSLGNSALVSNGSRAGRWLDGSATGNFALAGYLNASGNIGAAGKTLYVSFLQQPSSPTQFYEFEFHRGDLGDAGRIGGVGNDLANATTVNLRAPDSVETPMGLGNTNVNFYVVRIDYHGGSDDVYVYRNPTGPNESDNQPVLTMLGAADMSFNGLSMGAYLNGVTVTHDEVRLGQTWASVLGNPPLFVEQISNQLAYVGQSIVFTMLAQSSQPLNYQWYRGGFALAGQTNASLTLTNVQLADANQYSVTVSNALGVANSAVATLTVQTMTVAISNPSSLNVGPGSNLLINATIGGTLPVTLQWYRGGVAIAGATNGTYGLSNASVFDAGQYVLVASNPYGSVTSSIVNVTPNTGGLLAYEGFDYPNGTGNLPGQNGGTGWAGAWANIGGNAANVVTGSLSAGTNEPAGFDLYSEGNATFQPNASRSGRYLDCSAGGNFAAYGYLDTNGNIGANGKTLYLSFLQQPNSPGQFYEFEFHRGNLSDPGRMAGIGNDVGDSDVHFRVEAPAGGTSTFWDLGPGNAKVNFYVVRIDYKNGNDDVYIYRNPTNASESANVPAATLPGVGDMSFDGISFGAYLNNLTVTHDEVRLGLTWNDVIGSTVSSLRLASHANGQSQVQVAASPGYAYQIQGAPVVAGPWTNLSSVTASALGTGTFVESNVFAPQRFYRAAAELPFPNPATAGTVIADFDEATYGAWVATGTAFGTGPAQGTLPNQNPVAGYLGTGLVNSYNGGDGSTGTLTSPPFMITAPYLNFLIGGGNHPGQTCMNLLVSNVVVATATGLNSETLTPMQWNLGAYEGQTGVLQIVDMATGSWGHILIDEIVLTGVPFAQPAPAFLITNTLLNLPVTVGAPAHRVTLLAGTNVARDFNIQLATGTPNWWAFVDVSAFQGQTGTLLLDSQPASSTFANSLIWTNGIVGATNLYQESLRPQFHFSTKRGWLNDANGMVYAHGQYHLYYQHDPFNWDGTGQKWWGHAVSLDMVNWQEIQEGIYSHTYGDDVWSGSAVVDAANTGGFKSGTNDVIVAAFYSTARGECIAYSNDGGLTFADYTNNPVVVHSGTGRDPHLLWYAPSNYWVMAVYDNAGGNGVEFYSTPDFRTWTFGSKIYNGFYECPDLFQLPVDGNTNNLMWELNDGSSGYMLGQFNGVTFTPSTAELAGNNGSAFYASQTFTSMAPGDNRKVRIGWAQIGMAGMPYNQMMYFPTMLSLTTTSNGVRLCSQPLPEITNDVVNVYSWTNLLLAPGYNPLSGIRGTLFDVKAQFAASPGQTITFTFQGLSVTYNATAQQISCNGISNPLPPINGIVQLEILVDLDSIEIFGNYGQLYMPLPASNSTGNSLTSLGCTGGTATFDSLVVSKLKSIWPQP